ncbi:MAG TPA: tetratricopeptide repeat protein, partial [Myxococcaceae bacterium]|nr:tetratricopeptide repeat protein [Myxococcaceae bacterium]
PLAEYRAATDPLARLLLLNRVFEALFRFDALVLASVFLRTPSCRDDKVRAGLGEPRPSMGHWLGLLEALAGTVPAEWSKPLRAWVRRWQADGTLPKLIEIRNDFSHTALELSAIPATMAAFEPRAAACLADHPSPGELVLDDAGQVWVHAGALRVCCAPLLLPGALAGDPNTVLAYFRRNDRRRRVTYVRPSGGRVEHPESFAELAGFLSRAGVSILEPIDGESIDTGEAAHVLHDRMIERTRQALARLRKLESYRPDILVPRAEADAALRAFLHGPQRLLLVDGPKGGGKTSWLCSLAAARAGRDETVLFETGDRFDAQPFPGALGAHLNVTGGFAPALERMSAASSDERVVVAIDDIRAAGEHEAALLTLFAWVEQLGPESPLRVVISLPSSVLDALRARRPTALPAHLLAQVTLSRMSPVEIAVLADRLPVAAGPAGEALREARREALRRIEQDGDEAVRRPGLVVDLLESLQVGAGPPPELSAHAVYEQLFRREVQSDVAPGSHHSEQDRVARHLARTMMARKTDRLRLDDPDLVSGGIVGILAGGARVSPGYEGLLARGILREVLDEDEGDTFVSFANPRFFAYLAARTHPVEPAGALEAALAGLCASADAFPVSLPVAAHLLARCLRPSKSGGASRAENAHRALAAMGAAQAPLMRALAAVEPACFLSAFARLASRAAGTAEALLEPLMYRDGQPRLSARAAEALIDACAGDAPLLRRVRARRWQALWEFDEYHTLQREMAQAGAASAGDDPSTLEFRGRIAEAIGADLGEARRLYEAALAAPDRPRERDPDLLVRLGYVIGRLGEREEALSRLDEARGGAAALGQSKVVAEAWGNRGQILGELGRAEEARACLQTSLDLNRSLGLLVGECVVESLLGDLACAGGAWPAADRHLTAALDTARRVDNRWREAWILGRLARARRALGRDGEADALAAGAERLWSQLGARPQ